ncbi:MAG TPA: S1C family serine protease [Gemmatimonadaceae bacterium]|nr:S1C family serine protease [Gemmatimonadaceae bacterium]
MSSIATPSLSDLSTQLSSAVDQAARYTVAIRARRRIPSSGVIWRDGLIVSASHTVRRDGTVSIILPDGDAAEATVVGRDANTDLVVLRSADLPAPAPVADEQERAVGSLVLAVGRPGRNVSASFGIVSAVIDGWRTPQGRRVDGVLRLDLSVYDGFSGGPLVAASGRVLGVDNSALAGGSAAALPASVIDSIIDDLLARGHVRRPFIGVAVQPVSLSAATVARSQLATASALVVVSVADETPAERAGILVGDVLLRIDGRDLARPADLLDGLAAIGDGASATIDLLRGGDRKSLTVTPMDRGGRGNAE